MNPLYRIWWRTLMDLRPLLRFLAERFPKPTPWAIRLRWLAHLTIGNPLHTTTSAMAVVAWQTSALPVQWAAGLWLITAAVVEGLYRLVCRDGGWLVGWREGWRARRMMPSVWAQVAAKTHRVQAEVGTSKEPIASAVLRPIADHPKMGWWPRVEWPVVSWWVGPPPGRTLAALDQVVDALAANLSHAVSVAVDYERDTDSHGRLIIAFHDLLGETSPPPWAQPVPHEPHHRQELDLRRLRLVEDQGLEDHEADDGEVA